MTRVSRGKVKKRTWSWQGKMRTAWYFDVISNGERLRRQYASQTEAETALDDFREKQRNPTPLQAFTPHRPVVTLADATEHYLTAKARKRTVAEDKRQLEQLKAVFGAETPLTEITAARISQYKANRLATKSEHTGRPLTAAAVNRPLALMRHLLRLAHEECELLETVPRIRLEKEPQGRIRWLELDEEARLLAACAKSQNKELLAIVTVALETGLRRGELLGLTWDRVDMSRGILRLEVTKSGKRREVPMRQAVYDVLSALPGTREGRVWRSGNIRTAFEHAVTAAKLDSTFHFHDCRHHFASWFVMRGGNIVALQDLLGHASLSMTRRYSRLAPDHLRSEVAKTEKPRRAGVAVRSAHGTRTSHEVESGTSSLVSA
jgi:integrase